MADRHTPGPWSLWTSNSFRRFGSREHGAVCEPITQNDGHPDLYFRNGGPEGPDARLIAAAPDLLAALQKIYGMRSYRSGERHEFAMRMIAQEAIERAVGQFENIACTSEEK